MAYSCSSLFSFVLHPKRDTHRSIKSSPFRKDMVTPWKLELLDPPSVPPPSSSTAVVCLQRTINNPYSSPSYSTSDNSILSFLHRHPCNIFRESCPFIPITSRASKLNIWRQAGRTEWESSSVSALLWVMYNKSPIFSVWLPVCLVCPSSPL